MTILTGGEFARQRGLKDYRSLIRLLSTKTGKPWTGKVVSNDPVLARVDFNRWVADCECGGAEYVDPDDRIFFCCSCGNVKVHGHARPVIFLEVQHGL